MGGAYLLHPSCPMARGDLSNPLPPWWCLHADTLNKKLTLLVKEMREYVLHSLELFSPLPSFYLPLTTPALAFPYHFLLSIWRSIFYRVCISKFLDSQRGKKNPPSLRGSLFSKVKHRTACSRHRLQPLTRKEQYVSEDAGTSLLGSVLHNLKECL